MTENTLQKFNREWNAAAPWGDALENWKEIVAGLGPKASPQAKEISKSARETVNKQAKAFVEKLQADCAALESKVSPSVKAMLPTPFAGMNPDNHKMQAQYLHNRRELLKKAIAADPAPAAAKPASSPAPAPAAAIGRAIIHAAATGSPKLQKQIVAAVQAAHEHLMSRDQFNTLTPSQKMKFCKDGGKLFDTPKAKASPVPKSNWMPTPTPSMNRAAWNTLTSSQKMEFVKAGGKLTD